jgi:hypothetical protein
MKPYYYVFKPIGHLPSHKHATLEDAVKESQRLCEMHPNQTFEVLQCLAITSAPKPLVSTFYMDGVMPGEHVLHVGFPVEMMLPEIPDGYRQAVYRGERWTSPSRVLFAVFSERNNKWRSPSFAEAGGANLHYCEFIK